jgi:hypothetical protein
MNQLTKLMLQQENLRKQSNYSSLLQQYNTRNILECYTQATVVVDHVFTPKGHLCHLIPKSQHTSTTKAHYWYLIISTIGMKVHYWYLDHLYNWYSSIAFLTLPKTTHMHAKLHTSHKNTTSFLSKPQCYFSDMS